MRKPAKCLISLLLIFVLATPACISGGELGPIGQPIPMGTPGVPGLDTDSWQARSPVGIGTSQQVGNLTLVVNNVIRPANHIADDATFHTEPESDRSMWRSRSRPHAICPPKRPAFSPRRTSALQARKVPPTWPSW